MERVIELLNQYKPVNLVLHEIQLLEGLDTTQVQHSTLSGVQYRHHYRQENRFDFGG
jgi:predicted nucleic acid-binding OB-fold protein